MPVLINSADDSCLEIFKGLKDRPFKEIDATIAEGRVLVLQQLQLSTTFLKILCTEDFYLENKSLIENKVPEIRPTFSGEVIPFKQMIFSGRLEI